MTGWLKRQRATERMQANPPNNQNQENQANAGPSKTVTKILSPNSKMSDKKTQSTVSLLNCLQRQTCYWSCSVYKEKTPTQRAKFAAE